MTNEIKHITGLPDGLKPVQEPGPKPSADRPKFDQVLGNLINEVDSLQKTAEKTTEKLISGELEDVHQVVVAVEEAQTSFRLLMEIRNKMVDAYREVMKMQV